MKRFLTLIALGTTVIGLAGVTAAQTARGRTESPPAKRTDKAQSDVAATFVTDGQFDHDPLGKDTTSAEEAASEDASGNGADVAPRGGGGAPPNDHCGDPAVIPGSAVSYNPPLLSTTGATTDFCEARESCEKNDAGVSNTVWYSYTPDADGYIRLSTLGSDYDTVLSMFDGCAAGIFPCSQPELLACNDDYFFGQQSQLEMQVIAGSQYLIKVADYDTNPGGGLLDFSLAFIPANNLCANATPIYGTAYDGVPISTHNAQVESCEAQETCELNNVGVSNSVWFTYVPACDGLLSVNTNGSNYDTVLSIYEECGKFVAIDAPCELPAPIACDDDAGVGLNSQLTDVPVLGGIEYRIKVADYNTAQGGGWLDLNLLFSESGAPTADISFPADQSCVCGAVAIEGSAFAGMETLTPWTLEYRRVSGGGWTLLASDTSPRVDETLAAWNTAALTQGSYLLRLTVENACGGNETAIALVFVDKQLDDLELRAPADGAIVGGVTCVDGTAWDHCFDHYTVELRNLQGGAFQPVSDGMPIVQTVINDPLVPGGVNTNELPDGDYEMRLSAEDRCGHSATETRLITVDNTPPLVKITAPKPCGVAGERIKVYGTIADAHLAGWALQYTGGKLNHWVTFAQDTDERFDELLGTLDTADLEPCAYTIRLVARDSARVNCDDPHISETLVSLNVE